MSTYENRSGMTLVELLIVGIILVVVAGMIYSNFFVLNREMAEGSATTFLKIQAETTAEQIGRDIRGAMNVYASSVESAPSFDTRSSEIVMRDANGDCLAAYRIQSDTLQDMRNISAGVYDNSKYRNFEVGGIPVAIKASSDFLIKANRKSAELNLILKTTRKNHYFEIGARGDTFRCRR